MSAANQISEALHIVLLVCVFVLKDEKKANKEVVEHLEGVISVVVAGGQFQVVCGAKVTKIYDAVIEIIGDAYAGGDVEVPEEKQSIGNLILQKLRIFLHH